MTLDELFETPEYKAAVAETLLEFGLDLPITPEVIARGDLSRCLKGKLFPDQLGPVITHLKIDNHYE